jgi:hypothetical protein
VFCRASLRKAGDRMSLLGRPDALRLSDLAVSQGRTRAAVADRGVAGSATWLPGRDAIEIEDLLVDPDWMGQGLGGRWRWT